jgi:hypothetical protein
MAVIATGALVASGLSVALAPLANATGQLPCGITRIAAGNDLGLAVGTGGSVYAWGGNWGGMLGDGTTTHRSTPVQVSGLSGIVAVSAAYGHSLALAGNGTVYAWGDNTSGAIGDGTTTNRLTPVQVPGLTGVTAIAGDSIHSMALRSDGTVYAWGGNAYGGIGDGTTTDRLSPVQVPGLSGVTAIAAGVSGSRAIVAGGAVKAWGFNGYGQLGDGTTTNRLSPVQVSGLSGITAIGAGYYHSIAQGSDGMVYTWGRGAAGAIGAAATTNRLTPGQLGTANCQYAPTVTGVTESADPVPAHGSITFTLSWTDGNAGDQARAQICKTNAVSAGSCPGGAWAIGSLTSSSPTTVSYTTTGADVGAQSYYAFACDSTSRCSAATAGTFTVYEAAPVASSATATPNPVVSGDPVVFSMSWTDANPGDQARAVVCKTNAISAGSCPGGAWAAGSLTSGSATATYVTSSANEGGNDFYAFACDSTSRCSGSVAGAFTVVRPQCSDGVDNDGDGKTDHLIDPGCADAQDRSEGPTCPPVAGVIVCLSQGKVFDEFQLSTVTGTAVPQYTIVGTVDLYRFDVAGNTTTLPCVVLGVGAQTVNACADAGGVYVSHVADLVDEGIAPLPVVTVCDAELVVTVNGIGFNSVAAKTLC